MAAEVLDALDGVRIPKGIEAVHLPVLRHLEGIELSGQPAIDAVLEEFLRIAKQLPWQHTAGYLDVLPQDYLDNFGYVQLLGPGSIVEHPFVRVGIGLWGPHLHYPSHHHEAEELYHVLAGEPVFSSGDGRRGRPARATPFTTRRGSPTPRTSARPRPFSCIAGPGPSSATPSWWAATERV